MDEAANLPPAASPELTRPAPRLPAPARVVVEEVPWLDVAAAFPEPLPAGVDWPAEPPDMSGLDPAMPPVLTVGEDLYQGMVGNYWLCSWMDVYLEPSGVAGPESRAVSMERISGYVHTPAGQLAYPNPDDFLGVFVAPAAAGDPAMMHMYFDTSCTHYAATPQS